MVWGKGDVGMFSHKKTHRTSNVRCFKVFLRFRIKKLNLKSKARTCRNISERDLQTDYRKQIIRFLKTNVLRYYIAYLKKVNEQLKFI